MSIARTKPVSRGQMLEEISGLVADSPKLLQREFHVVTNDVDKGSFKVRVMQWNVLAQALCGGADNFVKCPPEALEFERRKLHILEEILRYDADIVCLQEVDMYSYLNDKLTNAGYIGNFYAKRYSPCLDHFPNIGPDGCAMFYKKDRFKSINLFCTKLSGNGFVLNHVAMLQTFSIINPNGPEKQFMVATTHLKAKEGYEEMRAIEGLSFVKNVSEQRSEPSLPIILCGDLNGDPTEYVYSIFTGCDLDLESSYCFLSNDRSEPDYTTTKVRGRRRGDTIETSRTIDYMWHSRCLVQVQALLKFPTLQEIGENRLPCMQYPSDHLSLVGDFMVA